MQTHRTPLRNLPPWSYLLPVICILRVHMYWRREKIEYYMQSFLFKEPTVQSAFRAVKYVQ